MKLRTKDCAKLKEEFSQALANKEFVLYFQPKLDLKEKVITRLEALIRWAHPKYGLLEPSQFMPLAEDSGFTIPLGEWILREACQISKQWQRDGYKPIVMSVNLSPKQFHHPQMTSTIEQVLKDTKLEPCYLDLEIAEMTVMDDISRINIFLKHLITLGISFSLDDYGTGLTTKSYLKDFPISTLKIDQSYISDLPHDKKNATTVSNMISMAHQLGIKVVAEGVENREQLEFLSELNCDLIQGYLVSRPLPAEMMAVLLVKK